MAQFQVVVEAAKMQPPLLCLLIPLAAAIPASTPAAGCEAHVAVVECQPTPAPEISERGLGDQINSYVDSLISDVGSDVSSFVGSGILDFPSGFPTGSVVESSLGISGGDLDAEPTQALNLP